MDLDGDGINDIITGSYNPGDLYFFKGNKDKTFAAGDKIRNKDGKVLNIGTASTPFAVDWDKDGDLDLLIGDQRGYVHFVANESGGKALKFGASRKVAVGGKDIMCGHGDSQPVVCDYDNDGKLDMLLGCGDGAVLFYRGQGKAEPAFEAPVEVVAKSSFSFGKEGPVAPGVRAKLCLADFNGDGVQDLLVGDFASRGGGMRKDLSEDEKKVYDELKEKSTEYSSKTTAILTKAWDEELEKLGKKREELSQEELLQVSVAVGKKVRADEEYRKASAELSKISGELRKYLAPRENQGFVWLFAGKAKKIETPGSSKAEPEDF